MDNPLLLGQIIYTSFPEIGYRLLTSSRVSPTLAQDFMGQIVQTRWDPYNPPRPGFRAAYLRQMDVTACLFGWLYSEEADDIGRSGVPLFISNVLVGPLEETQLDTLFTYLHRGPAFGPSQRELPTVLAELSAPDLWTYRPARPGVRFAAEVREGSYAALAQGHLLDLYTGLDQTQLAADLDARTSELLTLALSRYVGPIARVLVRKAISRSALLGDPYRRAVQVCRELTAEVEDPQAADLLRSEIAQVLKIAKQHQP